MPPAPALLRVYLLRHAQAAWPLPGESDFDRSLDETGLAQADAVAATLRAQGWSPQKILCSPARRCRQTAAPLEQSLDASTPTIHLPELYTGSVAVYHDLIAASVEEQVASLLIIGHNPMIETVLRVMVGDAPADRATGGGYAPAALSVIDIVRSPPGSNALEGTLSHYLTAG